MPFLGVAEENKSARSAFCSCNDIVIEKTCFLCYCVVQVIGLNQISVSERQ